MTTDEVGLNKADAMCDKRHLHPSGSIAKEAYMVENIVIRIQPLRR